MPRGKTPRWFVAALIVGAIVRIGGLPLSGTGDTVPWRIWSYNAAREGVSRLYGVGGTPPEHRVLTYLNASTTVDYPPLALIELELAGLGYRAVTHGAFPNTPALMVAIKMPGLAADVCLAIMVFGFVRRRVNEQAARWATLAYWLNPAVVLDGAVLGYLDLQCALPLIGSLLAAAGGSFSAAGALAAAAALTKPQAIVAFPALALAVWAQPEAARGQAAGKVIAAGAVTGAIIVAPVFAAGGGPNMIQAIGRLAAHDMLSANACNLWWIVGYLVRVQYTVQDYGFWGAVTRPTKILQISRFIEVGYPNPRPIGVVLVVLAIAWALWTARRSRGAWGIVAVGAFTVHAYATLAAQVHENHLFLAVPLLVLAAAGEPRYRRVLWVVSAIVALNLNLFYGIGQDLGYAFPRGMTVIDATVVLAVVNCVAFAWHASVLHRHCRLAGAVSGDDRPFTQVGERRSRPGLGAGAGS